MTPLPDYLKAECRVAARLVADVVRAEIAAYRGCRKPPAAAVETLECNLIRYFSGVMVSLRNCGVYRHSFSRCDLCLVFERWERWLAPLAYVVIQPGRVAMKSEGRTVIHRLDAVEAP